MANELWEGLTSELGRGQGSTSRIDAFNLGEVPIETLLFMKMEVSIETLLLMRMEVPIDTLLLMKIEVPIETLLLMKI